MPIPREKVCDLIQDAIAGITELPPFGAEPIGAFIVIPCQDGRILNLFTHDPDAIVEKWALLGAARMALTENEGALSTTPDPKGDSPK